MGLRIRTNVASQVATRALADTTNRIGESMNRLSSGYRINKAADDAAGLAISENYRASIRALNQAQRNANDGVSIIQTAEGSMNEITNILIRLRELSIQSASDTIGNTERMFTNREYTQLVDEIDRITATTEFNGVKLLAGNEGNDGLEKLVLHIGKGNGFTPNTDTIEIGMDDIKLRGTEDLGLGKGEEIGPLTADVKFDRILAADKIKRIDDALTKISSTRATIGAKQSRLQSAIQNLGTQVENMSSANSRVRDVDFAGETATFTQEKILMQSGISVLTQANQLPEAALNLLR